MVSTTDQLFGASAYAPLIVATDRGPVSAAAATTGLPSSLQSAVTSTQTTTSGATKTATSSASPAAAAHGTVRIQDVASVVDSVEDIHTGGAFNGKPAILVIVFAPDYERRRPHLADLGA